jgi:type VI secretion system secreted protein VgrG
MAIRIDEPMTLKTTLGDALMFKSMVATEELGRMFEFDVEALADSGTIKPDDLLGKPATVSVEMDNQQKRYFHGLVCAIETGHAMQRQYQYRLSLRPWLWMLTRRSDTRVFQQCKVEDILRKVFEPFSPKVEFQLTGDYPTYDYCVQYRESDFNFVSRLMEQEGIYYYFKHTQNDHTMVIVDAPSAHGTHLTFDSFEYRSAIDAAIDFDGVTEWRTRREIQSGQVVLRDYNFTKPKDLIEGKYTSPRDGASARLEVYDYPGRHTFAEEAEKAEVTRYSRLRMEELQARYVRVDGAGSTRAMACGHKFMLVDHPRDDQNKKNYLLVSTRYEMRLSGYESGSEQTTCHCSFSAIPDTEIFRSARIAEKPVVSGLHTAVVVGPGADEIHTDQHGRVRVQFHWDRHGKNDDKSSCWVRVSSPWAGKGWGGISLPRKGQEVVVDFLGGDPDKPLITGRVYNAEQTPPYALPANATVSTNKSRSSQGGAADNFNELRFEDKKGDEYIWFQAEKDFHQFVKNDATLLVKGKQDRVVNLDLTEQIDGAVKVKIGKDSVTEVKGKHSLDVTGDMMTESKASISQKSGAKTDIKVGADLGVDATANIHIKAGVNLVIEAGAMITLKAGRRQSC